jgi:hypothetical protein
MPVTPFHLGPALIAKALLRRHFSLGVFTMVQGIIDVESVTNILREQSPVHAHLHTAPGALAVGVVSVALGAPLCTWINGWVKRWPEGQLDFFEWARDELQPVTATGAIVGALFGALSHVALDGMMHPDAQPFWPFIRGNPLLVEGAFMRIHLDCAVAGMLGMLAWMARVRWGQARADADSARRSEPPVQSR